MANKRPIINKLPIRVWLPRVLDAFISKLVVAVTFIMIPVSLGFIIYYSLFNFDLNKSLVGCAMLFVMPYVNTKIQGGK